MESGNALERTQYHLIDSGNMGITGRPLERVVKNVLVSRHNAGFFSCSTIALQDLMIYFNTHGKLPDEFDRAAQYANYKASPNDNLIPALFDEHPMDIPWTGRRDMVISNREQQFSPYKNILFEQVLPFVNRYFQPSQMVRERAEAWIRDYDIKVEETAAIFHRGNDKCRETQLAENVSYLEEAAIIGANRLFVIPDHRQFWETVKGAFPDRAFRIDSLPLMDENLAISLFMTLSPEERGEHAINFLAQVYLASRCAHLITHSGNGGFWAVLYRGNANGVRQWLDDRWI